MNLKVGERYLIRKHYNSEQHVDEIYVIEVAGKHFKAKWNDHGTTWSLLEDYRIVKMLPNLSSDPKSKGLPPLE